MTYTKHIPFLALLMLAFILPIHTASATTLQAAKASGVVGEKENGYIGIVGKPSTQVKALVQSINQKRKSKYQKIAQTNNTSLQAIQTLAGKKTIQKTATGQYVQQGGRWLKK